MTTETKKRITEMNEKEETLLLLQTGKEDDNSLFSLSGILAGFSFTAVLFSLSFSSPSNLRPIALGAFLAATFFFIGSTIISMAILESTTAIVRALQLAKADVKLTGRSLPRGFCYTYFLLGLGCVLAGTSLLGFMCSATVGVGAVVLAFIVITGVVISVVKLEF